MKSLIIAVFLFPLLSLTSQESVSTETVATPSVIELKGQSAPTSPKTSPKQAQRRLVS